MKKTSPLLALLVATLLALTACGSNRSSNASGDTSTGARFDKADVAFAQGMIPHHQQAVQMSRMARSHAAGVAVTKLADGIEAAQGPEIDTMTRWLKAWGKSVPTSSNQHGSAGGGMKGMEMGDGSHMDTSNMPGMMSARDLGQLDRARGARWDQMFLTMMIDHHAGAIEMARAEQAHGSNPDAIALAKRIEAAQTAEIAKMHSMLRK